MEFFYRRAEQSTKSANLFFIWNVLRSFRLINFKKSGLLNNWTMNLLKNYTKIYFRRFRKETAHYLVNIFGLGLGFAILFFILMFVYDEQGIDQYHAKKDRIYRIVEKSKEEDGIHDYLSTSNAVAAALKADFPVVEQTAHMTYLGSQVLGKGDIRIADRDWAMVSKGIFDILDFEIISGNPKKEFEGQAGIVLEKEMARALFGTTDVVGEVVDESNFGPVEVLAVIEAMPANSSYRFKAIYVFDVDQLSEGWQNFLKSWDTRFMQTWVLLKEGATPEDIYAKKSEFLEKYYNEEIREEHDFYLHPLSDLHLGSTHIENGGPGPLLAIPYSDRQFVSMILLMGFLVIFIAALNYINLSSVQALKRTLEASMRKINGANARQLVGQLFFETLFTIVIAFLISMLLVIVLFPYFLQITNKSLELVNLFSAEFIISQLAAVLVIWVASALLPALYYSKLKRSLLILKNAFSGKGDKLRKVLVGIQYALSLFLIIGSMVIYRQLNYVQSKDLGFDNDNLIVMDINSRTTRQSFKGIIEDIKKNPNVVNATTSSRVPGEWKNIPHAFIGERLTESNLEASFYGIEKNWLDTYGIQLTSGQNFSGVDETDSLYILVNEQAVEMLGFEEPLGKSIWVIEGGNNGDTARLKILGVVENFHFESLYETIGPVVLGNWNNHIMGIDYFTIKYSQNPRETVSHIEMVNDKFDPETPAEINFLDQQWNRFYEAEESRATIILIASVVSIIISAFGLFGLINFTVERKTKEIGIRKVMGASVPHILNLVLKDYLILLLIALAVSAPVSWWLFEDWLSDFAYRINLSIDLFIIAFGTVLVISSVTVVSRIFRIAKANPVAAIKYE